jgi:hypothetical protein
VIRRDLGAAPPPHPDALTLESASLPAGLAHAAPAGGRGAGRRAAGGTGGGGRRADRRADVQLLGALGPQGLVRPGQPAGPHLPLRVRRPRGPAQGKTIVAVTGRGGFYELAPPAGRSEDLQESLIRSFFGFMGLEDVRFIHAEGQGIDPRRR